MGVKRKFGRFYLDTKPDGNGALPLMYEFTWRGQKTEDGKYRRNRLRHYTGSRVPGKIMTVKKKKVYAFWDAQSQVTRGFKEADDINAYIMALTGKVSKYLRDKKENFKPVELGELKRLISTAHSAGSTDIVSYCENFLKKYDRPGQESTKKNVSTMVSALREFAGQYPPFLQNVNKEYIESFISFLINTKQNNNTTVEKKVHQLKQILRAANKQGLLPDTSFEDVKIKRSPTDIIFLKQQELGMLEDHNAGSEKYQKVKDAFLFGCYSGLRYSDLQQINQTHFQKKREKGAEFHVLRFVIKKTRKSHEIALPEKAVRIIEKYWEKQRFKKLLPVFSNQKFNDYIKDLCKAAAIDTEIEITAQYGSEVKTVIKKKHEVVSCHSARHTYAIVSLENGMRPEVLQRNMGHSKLSQTMDYVKILDNVRHIETLKAFTVKNPASHYETI